jgi:hypothetical protein
MIRDQIERQRQIKEMKQAQEIKDNIALLEQAKTEEDKKNALKNITNTLKR